MFVPVAAGDRCRWQAPDGSACAEPWRPARAVVWAQSDDDRLAYCGPRHTVEDLLQVGPQSPEARRVRRLLRELARCRKEGDAEGEADEQAELVELLWGAYGTNRLARRVGEEQGPAVVLGPEPRPSAAGSDDSRRTG